MQKLLTLILLFFSLTSLTEIKGQYDAQAKRVIIIYGRNNHDDRVWLKYAQLKKLGGKAKVYIGGLFEWILLQELYGNERFPLTSAKFDPYQYSPK